MIESRRIAPPHLAALGAVVVDVEDVEIHDHPSLRPPVGGRDLERVSVAGLSVQGFFGDQTPLALVLLDDGELAQRVSVCRTRWRAERYSLFFAEIDVT